MHSTPATSSVNSVTKRLLPSTSGPKWLALAGAGGATLAAAIPADAALVQVTQTNIHSGGNFVSAAVNSFSADLTGDGVNDALLFPSRASSSPSYFAASVGGVLNAYALFVSFAANPYAVVFSGARFTNAFGLASNIPIAGPVGTFFTLTFTDTTLKSLPNTNAVAEIFGISDGSASGTRMTITRLIFDDTDASGASLPTFLTASAAYPEASPIPEPSGLALLALGAGGLLLHRRREKASRQAVQDV